VSVSVLEATRDVGKMSHALTRMDMCANLVSVVVITFTILTHVWCGSFTYYAHDCLNVYE